jgi:hypothetical protein
MNYDQKRLYFMCKYGGDANSPACSNFFRDLHHIKNYIIRNPIGFVFNKKHPDEDRKYLPLSAWYDRDTRQYYYYVIDHDIIHTVETNNQMLYDGQQIKVPSLGKMNVRIYDETHIPHGSHKYGIIYNDAYYKPNKHPYYRNLPIDQFTRSMNWQTVGYIKQNKKIHKLYEKQYPNRDYGYRILVHPGIYLDVINPSRNEATFTHRLYDGDTIRVDTLGGKWKTHIQKYSDIII